MFDYRHRGLLGGFLILALTISSCKGLSGNDAPTPKPNDDPTKEVIEEQKPEPSKYTFVKRIESSPTANAPVDITAFEYDELKRMKRITAESKGGDEKNNKLILNLDYKGNDLNDDFTGLFEHIGRKMVYRSTTEHNFAFVSVTAESEDAAAEGVRPEITYTPNSAKVNEEGKIIEFQRVKKDRGATILYQYNLTWKEGNLTRIDKKSYDGEILKEHFSIEYTYSDLPNLTNLNLSLVFGDNDLFGYFEFNNMLPFDVMNSKNLPNQKTVKTTNGEENINDTSVSNYTYKMDDKTNVPIEMTVSSEPNRKETLKIFY